MFSQLTEELEPMSDVGDHCIGADILLPRGDKIARDCVVLWSCNASGNVMGRAHVNQILVPRIYQVDFVGGKVTELTANVIAESMYAQCDADRNNIYS